MLTFVKLGGSLITHKHVESSFRAEVVRHIAAQLRSALDTDQTLQLLIGHGSGSYGHVAAKQYDTIHGVLSEEQWRGFAQVSVVAAELNYLMAQTLNNAGIAVLRFQPSASAIAHDGSIVEMSVEPIRRALEQRLVPLLYGDVAFDNVRGGTIISTETIFFYLAQQLPVTQILLVGEVDGVYDGNGTIIPSITPATLVFVEQALGGSAGTDVTGGMETKVRDMVALVQALPQLTIRILSGLHEGLLRDTLLGRVQPGTLIHSG